jgi:NTE family protein
MRHSHLAALPLSLALLLSLDPSPAHGAPETRPRVCLALSGGGAVGLAHVGVLRALEELRVPIDCVTGTSMGAVVGGLYAAGYSPEELEHIVQRLDWSALLRDTPDRRRLPFRRKIDDLTYLSRWELGVARSGLKTPAGIVAGHRIGATLHLLTLRAGGVEDFDELARPFRAIATDARTGETVVLGRGDLGVALRASMAIPGLFAPVQLDGRVLVDGGIVDNLPVGAARSLGADVVIAVDLDQPLATRERPDSIGSILSGSLGVLSRREVERSLAQADFVIRPGIVEYGLLDFQAAGPLIERGALAVAGQADALGRLALDEEAWARHVAARRRTTPKMPLASVTIDPGPGLAPAAVARSVRSLPGKPLDPQVLAADLDRLWELGELEAVDFSLDSAAAAGTWDLRITARPKAWGPNYLRFGVALASDLEGTSSFNVLTDLTMTRLDRLGGELKLAVQGGEQTVLSAEMYQPLSSSRVPFAALGLQGGPTKVQLPVGTESVQYRFVEQRAALDLGLALGRYGETRVGVRHEQTRGRPTDNRRDESPHFDRTDAGFRWSLIIDQLDRVNFPRRGLLAATELYESSPGLGADEDYRRWDLQTVSAATRGRHTLVGLLHGSSALGGTLPVPERLRLGGLFSLSGLPPGELSGSYGGVATLLYMFRLGRVPRFADGIYAGATVEAGNAWERAADVDLHDLRTSYAIVFGIDTLIGPVYAAQGWTSGGKDSLYLYVGRSF